MKEEQLIRLAQKGDAEAFSALVQLHQSTIYSIAYRYCGNPEDAEDITQEVFLSAWTHLPNFRGDSSLSTWLCRMAINASHNLYRKEKKADNNLSLDDEESPVDLPDTQSSPHEMAERHETQEEVQQALLQLSEDHRTVLVLREIEQYSYEEIARLLHLDLGTVKSRIHRARKECAEYLSSRGTFCKTKVSKEHRKETGKEDLS